VHLPGIERRSELGDHRGEACLLTAQVDHGRGQLAVAQLVRIDMEQPIERRAQLRRSTRRQGYAGSCARSTRAAVAIA
jgi:hypothetical protein